MVRRLSSSVTPAAGTAISADAPPDNMTSTCSTADAVWTRDSARHPARSLSSRGYRVAPDDRLERRRHLKGAVADHEAGDDTIAKKWKGCFNHRRRGLTYGDELQRRVEGPTLGLRQGAFDEATGMNGLDSSADDRPQIASKGRKKTVGCL